MFDCSLAACHNLDVADGELGHGALAMAAVVPQPGGITSPVGDDEGHAVGQIL